MTTEQIQNLINERNALAAKCGELTSQRDHAIRQRNAVSKEWDRLAHALIKFQRHLAARDCPTCLGIIPPNI
jgi:hypothetical protein